MNIYHYEGFNKRPAKCGLEFIKEEGRVTVIMTELDDNPGTSVTNMVELLATKIYNEHLKDNYAIDQVQWIEHYPERSHMPGKNMIEETWDEVKMKWDGKKFEHPKWKHLKEHPSLGIGMRHTGKW